MDPKPARRPEVARPEAAKKIANEIPGYRYGTAGAARSPVSLADLELLKKTVNITEEHQRNLLMAVDALAGHSQEVVRKWRGGGIVKPLRMLLLLSTLWKAD